MPATSKAQQKFMGMVHGLQKGTVKPSDASAKVKKVADSMSDKDAEDFASTKHKKLPNKVKKEIIAKLRELVRIELEGTCGYAPDGKLDVHNTDKLTPAGPHLLKKKKKNESVNEGFTKYHIRLTKTPGWYGVWDKNGKQKFEGDRKFVMKHLKKLKTRMGNYQLKSLIDVATKRKGKDIEFDVVESVVKEAGMGILDSDQSDILQGIVLRNKNKSLKSILSVALKSGYFKGVDKKELLGYIDGAKQFVKYMKSHPMESINEGKWSKIMRSVRKGSKAGPWSIVVYDKRERKVKHQRLVKILQQIPAHYEDVKKKYPRDKIGIEDKYGERVYTESINESDLDMLERSGDYGWDWKNLTVKKGKTVKVTHKKSGKSLIIIDKPNVKREYEKIGYFAEGTVNELSMAPFSSQEARLHIDADIKKMSKELGKTSHDIIKIMMNGVKRGRYTAMDIQRGLKEGPAGRTHFGEMTFIRSLWSKMREKFRRYSKDGKLS